MLTISKFDAVAWRMCAEDYFLHAEAALDQARALVSELKLSTAYKDLVLSDTAFADLKNNPLTRPTWDRMGDAVHAAIVGDLFDKTQKELLEDKNGIFHNADVAHGLFCLQVFAEQQEYMMSEDETADSARGYVFVHLKNNVTDFSEVSADYYGVEEESVQKTKSKPDDFVAEMTVLHGRISEAYSNYYVGEEARSASDDFVAEMDAFHTTISYDGFAYALKATNYEEVRAPDDGEDDDADPDSYDEVFVTPYEHVAYAVTQGVCGLAYQILEALLEDQTPEDIRLAYQGWNLSIDDAEPYFNASKIPLYLSRVTPSPQL